LSKNVLPATESPLPQSVTQHRDLGSARFVFCFRKKATDHWSNLNDFGKIAGCSPNNQPLGVVNTAKDATAAGEGGHCFERLRLLPPVNEVRERSAFVISTGEKRPVLAAGRIGETAAAGSELHK
jgi:hypothetical protein